MSEQWNCTSCKQSVEATQKFCANCGADIQKQMTKEQPTIKRTTAKQEKLEKITIKGPVMSGNTPLSDIVWGSIYVFLGLLTINGKFFLISNPSWYWLGWLMIAYAFVNIVRNTPPKVTRQCPHCGANINYTVPDMKVQCPRCKGLIQITWT